MKLLSFPRSLGDRFRATYAANPRRFRFVFFAILAVVVVLMSVKYAAKIAKPGDTGEQSRSAFLRWRHMINGVFAGENVYVGKNEYPNPPIMAILLRPFAALPPMTGALAWFYAKVLLAVLACVWVFRLVGGGKDPTPQPPPPGGEGEKNTDPTPQPPPPRGEGEKEPSELKSLPVDPQANSPSPPGGGGWGVGPVFTLDLSRAAAIVLCLPALLGDLSHNNVNIFILFLVVGCLEAFRRRLDTLAGLTLALAIACKVTPLLFVAYFGWKRSWRVLVATLAGLVLWLAVVPGVTFGWDRNRQLMGDWYALMVERPMLKGEITTERANQSVSGWVHRLFTHSPSDIDYVKTPEGDIPTPAEYHNFTDIGRPAAAVVVKLVMASFALALVWLCRVPVRRSSDPREGWRFAAECGFVCLGMLLFSERTWKHHAVVLLLPLAALTYAVATVELPRRVRNFTLGALVASFVLMIGTGVLAGRAADLAMVYGTYFIAFVLLTLAVGLLLACRSGRVGGSRGLNVTPIP